MIKIKIKLHSNLSLIKILINYFKTEKKGLKKMKNKKRVLQILKIIDL